MNVQLLIQKSVMPLIAINGSVAAVTGFFIINDNHWRLMWPMFIGFLFSSFIFPLLLLPAGIFARLMPIYASAGRQIMVDVMVYLSLLSVSAAVILYMTLAFAIASPIFHGPLAVYGAGWAVSAAALTWLLYSLRDRENAVFPVMVFAAEIAAAISAALALHHGLSVGAFFLLQLAIVALPLAAWSVFERSVLRPRKNNPV